jgi:hypothetical protein
MRGVSLAAGIAFLPFTISARRDNYCEEYTTPMSLISKITTIIRNQNRLRERAVPTWFYP